MSVNNLTQDNERFVTEYTPLGGEPIKLSPVVVRNYLVSGNGKVTDGEIMMFIALCKEQKLNPFLKEAYLIKYGERSPASIVVGKEAFMKRAVASADYDQYKAGAIVLRGDEIVYTMGAFKLPKDVIVGGWADVYLKSKKHPIHTEVSFEEYFNPGSNGRKNSWDKKPLTMIRKVALVQALREAFPNHLGAMYTSEEIQRDDQEPIDVTPEPKLEANTEVLDMPEESEVLVPDEVIPPEEDGHKEPDEQEMQQIIEQEIKDSQEDEPDWMK